MIQRRLPAAAAMVLALSVAAAPARAAEPFTLIVVPDTQNYTDFADINTTYNLGQMRWIRDNMTNLNIKFVMHLGDLQNPGNPYRARTDNIYEPDFSRPLGDVDDKLMKWGRADDAIQVLDNNHIPYSLVPGNHDYLDHNTKSEPWLYLKTFGPSRYTANPKFDENNQPTYGGASPVNPNNGYAGMNTYHRFAAGGYKFMNVALQYNPDDDDLKWAQQIINENPGLPTIITTHAFVNTKPAANDYQHPDIFNKLVKNNPQVLMTFNGHLTGAHHIASENIAGHTVHQMLVDFQASQLDAQLGGDYYRGGGTLRTVQFDPDAGRVNIKDYSPIADRFLPNQFTAPDNDGDIATYDTPSGFNLDLEARFGLPNKGGVTRTLSLRQGVNGYTGNVDTFIDANDTATNHGNDSTAWVDGDRNGGTAGTPDAQGLIRFNDVISASRVPAGAMIEAARLTLHTSDLTDSQSPNTIGIYRLLAGWTEAGATWDSLGGMLANGGEALLAPNGTVVPDVQGAFVTFDVTESLYTLAAGAPNHGWVLLPGGGNGWQWDTSEHANVNFRPQLDVTYRIVPEPGSLAAVACGVALLLRERGRRPLHVTRRPARIAV
jgi:hypothetical protein